MSYHQLFERAYALCMRFNSPAIYDITTMNKDVLMSIIYLLSRWQES